MQVSIHWIREFCPFETDETPVAIGDRFSLHTAEVERVIERCADLGDFRTARVLEVRPHPDADRLRVTRVDAGGNGTVEVVCGAPNVREGMVVPYAAPGVVVGGRTITELAVRGVTSRGMLCSEAELGVSEAAAGLWELPEDTPPGTSLLELFPHLKDIVLEIDNKSITHRPDLWGHYGIAREFSAVYRVPLRPLRVSERLARARGESAIRVSMEGDGVGGRDGLCRRYCGLQIDGVRIGPSPEWLAHRLMAVGSRPINNVVDVTNYILHELGQPLHAFDVQRVGGGEIRVRRGRPGEKLRLLDGTDVELEPSDCVIADARDAVALAGIMGGASSEIAGDTTSIFLESANFAPAPIRRTSLRVGKRTDSSARFEKSLDPESARVGILRAARLIVDLCPGARVVGPLQDVGYEPAPPIEISTSGKFIVERLGAGIPPGEVRETLKWLGFKVQGKTAGTWRVTVPSWRATKDISLCEDLVEEVGRIHGYDSIRPFGPLWKVEAPPVDGHRQLERRAKEYLALHAGLSEVYTYSMVGKSHCQRFGMDAALHLALKNPISEDMDRMRREIVPIHIEKARNNLRYGGGFGFFELGRVYRKAEDRLRAPELPDERNHLTGLRHFVEKRPGNFHVVRDSVLGLLEHLRLQAPEILPPAEDDIPEPWEHQAVRARVRVAGRDCGRIYRVHPQVEAKLEIKGDLIAFDLDFDALVGSPRLEVEYRPPLRYPTVPFDVAVVAGARVPVRDILKVIEGAAGALLLGAEVFDVFEGEQSGAGNKSVAFHLVFGSKDKTLSREEVTRLQDSVMDALKTAGYPLRQ